ncbi:glutathione S-transferase [Bradyrhizobium sp. GM6.1]
MSDNPDLTLWGVGTSRTVRPHWAMHELGLAYEIKPIGPRTGETKTAEYTRLNPRQKIPLLQDGDFRIGRERRDRRLSVADVLNAGACIDP